MAFSDIVWGVATESLRLATFSEYPQILQKLKEASEAHSWALLIELMQEFELGSDLFFEFGEGLSDLQEMVGSFGGHIWCKPLQPEKKYYDIIPENLRWLTEKEDWIKMMPSEHQEWFYNSEDEEELIFAHIEDSLIKTLKDLADEQIEKIFDIPTYVDHTILKNNEILVETIDMEMNFIAVESSDLYKVKSGFLVHLGLDEITKIECNIITINGCLMAYYKKQ